MIRFAIVFLLTFNLSINIFARGLSDSTMKVRLKNLAEKMQLKAPDLARDEYEVRIWKKVQLLYGDAHEVYILSKREKILTINKYIINSDKAGFKHAVELNSTTPTSLDLWKQLMEQDILVLPNELAIVNQLHPQQKKDSTYITTEQDGSVSVHAKKIERSVWVLDGESYYFEVFGMGSYRSYGYSNPREYLKYKPEISELQKVVAILDKLALAFRSSKKKD